MVVLQEFQINPATFLFNNSLILLGYGLGINYSYTLYGYYVRNMNFPKEGASSVSLVVFKSSQL
jgi:hypothetical protein